MDSTTRDKSECSCCGARHNSRISCPIHKVAVPELDRPQLGIVCAAQPDRSTVKTNERLSRFSAHCAGLIMHIAHAFMASTPHLTAALNLTGVEFNEVLQCCPPACNSSAKQGSGVCFNAWECHIYCYHLSLQSPACPCVNDAVIRDDLKDAPTPAVTIYLFGGIGSCCSQYL